MRNSPIFPIFSLLLLHLFSQVSSSFTPTDHYLISCGSTAPSITDSNNRKFAGDASLPHSVRLSASRTIPLSKLNPNPSGVVSPLYNSVRIFRKPSKYAFQINQRGAHLVRLHFHRFDSSKFDFSDAQFHVLADGYLLLNEFSGLTMKSLEIREYILWVNDENLEISFKPLKNSKFGFVNAIEVISVPKDLILDVAQFVDSNGVVKIDGISKNAFETMFRVNVGGAKVTPFNDTLWRTWGTDDGFLESDHQGSKEVHFGGRIKYQLGGASREVAPDNVYNSARVVSASSSGVAKEYLTWGFPIVDGYKYLVRTHFCDIASPVLGSLYFNVYVNGKMAMKDLDLSTITNSLASPYYADFVVNGENGVIRVSIGHSNLSSPSGVDALLNGIEVFKMSNSMDSLDGMVSAKSILRCRGGNSSFLVLLVAAVGLLVAASVILRKRLMGARDSVAWSRLPMDVSEVSLKPTH